MLCRLEETLRKRAVFSKAEIDCATAVMLKILDGKCKMPEIEKKIMADLYQLVRGETGICIEQSHHDLIGEALAMGELDDEMRNYIYEQRLYAETMISRPVMKSFKAMLRDIGILPRKGGA